MTTFLTVLFVIFLFALLLLGVVLYKAYRWLTRLGVKVSGSGNTRRRAPHGGSRSRGRRKGSRGRIIPPEYAEDADYDVVSVTGKETFVRVDDVLSGRGETQISEADYTVISVKENRED